MEMLIEVNNKSLFRFGVPISRKTYVSRMHYVIPLHKVWKW